jgi:hypothetical protein
MDKLFALSEQDRDELKWLLHRLRNRPYNSINRGIANSIEDEEAFGPEIYIAKTPGGGIPAFDGTNISAADCEIYRTVDLNTPTTLEDAGFTKTVYNLSSASIPANTFIQVMRDKFGRWLQVMGGGGGLSIVQVQNNAPIFRSKTSAHQASGSSFVISKPAGVVQNDIVLAHMVHEQISGNGISGSGWTTIRTDHAGAGNTINSTILYKIAGNSEPSTYTFTNTSALKITGSLLAYYNYDSTSPIQGHAGAYASAASIAIPGLTTSAPNTLLLGFAGVENTDGSTTETVTSDASMTSRSNLAGVPGIDAAELVLAVAGASGNKTATFSPAGTFYTVGQMVALNPCLGQGGGTNIYDGLIQVPVPGSKSFTTGSLVWIWAFMGQPLTASDYYFAIPSGGNYTAPASCGGGNQSRPLYLAIGGWDIGQGVCVPGGIQLSTY